MIYKLSLLFVLAWAAIPASSSVKIAAFNVQVFGQAKMDKPDAVDTLVDIILRYDLVIIQEIRDASETAFPELVGDVNAQSSVQYSWFTSERLGRTSSKEQYGYIYRSDRVKYIEDESFQYPDVDDVFEREPYVAQFQLVGGSKTRFNTIILHSKPDDAETEVSALVDVYDDAVQFNGVEQAVILGDMNADCNYITASEWPDVRLRTDPRFTWMIGDSADTTVSTTDCAYDRIVTAGDAMLQYSNSAAVFNYETYYGLTYDEAKAVSDHYPVEFIVS